MLSSTSRLSSCTSILHFPLHSTVLFPSRPTPSNSADIKMKLMWVDGFMMWVLTSKICYFGDQRNKWNHDGLQQQQNKCIVTSSRFQWWPIESSSSPPAWRTDRFLNGKSYCPEGTNTLQSPKAQQVAKHTQYTATQINGDKKVFLRGQDTSWGEKIKTFISLDSSATDDLICIKMESVRSTLPVWCAIKPPSFWM